jgi:hypothetical protein
MTQDEIIEMLRASCDKDRVDPEQNGFWVIVTEELEAFAKLVADKATDEANARANASWTLMCKKMVEAEREACVMVCDYEWGTLAEKDAGIMFAAAIRARGEA